MFSDGQKEFHRGDIYYCEFVDVGGSVQSGLRPALIIQNEVGNKYGPTLIVAPITSIIKKKRLPTHVYVGEKFGLKENSMIMLEQINTVDKHIHIRDYIGTISDRKVMEEINEALRISLATYGK